MHAARRIAMMAKTLPTNPYQILGSGPESRAYAVAAGAEDWIGADRICPDRLEAVNCRTYLEMLRMECLAREFTRALAEEAFGATTICRWMDWDELASYLKGTFKSRMEAGGVAADTSPSAWGSTGTPACDP